MEIFLGILSIVGIIVLWKLVIPFDDSELISDKDQLSGYDQVDHYDYKHGRSGYKSTHK